MDTLSWPFRMEVCGSLFYLEKHYWMAAGRITCSRQRRSPSATFRGLQSRIFLFQTCDPTPRPTELGGWDPPIVLVVIEDDFRGAHHLNFP
jgi:hypothetical protein